LTKNEKADTNKKILTKVKKKFLNHGFAFLYYAFSALWNFIGRTIYIDFCYIFCFLSKFYQCI